MLFRRLVEHKFNIDLSHRPPCIVTMGNTTGHDDEAYAYPGGRHKISTLLSGFSRQWPHERSRLRILRSADRNHCAFELAAEFGRMRMFRVCDHSWHGFLPQTGQRMSLQLCGVDCERTCERSALRHGVSALAKALPLLRKAIDWAPRRLPGAR